MKHALPPLTQDRIEAFTASAVLWLTWLMGVVAKLGAPRKSRLLHRFASLLEREVESIFFLKALRCFGPVRRKSPRPRSAPPGFHRQRRTRLRLFFVKAGVRARKAGFGQRLARLAAALANPEPYIAYFFTRILRGLRGARLIAVAPPAHTLSADAPRNAAIADSS